jgi:hypothetical protein
MREQCWRRRLKGAPHRPGALAHARAVLLVRAEGDQPRGPCTFASSDWPGSWNQRTILAAAGAESLEISQYAPCPRCFEHRGHGFSRWLSSHCPYLMRVLESLHHSRRGRRRIIASFSPRPAKSLLKPLAHARAVLAVGVEGASHQLGAWLRAVAALAHARAVLAVREGLREHRTRVCSAASGNSTCP